MTTIRTTAELNAALAALPEFSRKVYDAIQSSLYAEPGFSDVTAKDIQKKVGAKAPAVNAAIGHLESVGLVFSEPWEANGQSTLFLHTTEHDEQISR